MKRFASLREGGPGSGDAGHAGRPGEVGGSGASEKDPTDRWVKSPLTYERFKGVDANGKKFTVNLTGVGPSPFGKNTIMGDVVETSGEVKAECIPDPKGGSKPLLQTHGHVLDLSLVTSRQKLQVYENLKYGTIKVKPVREARFGYLSEGGPGSGDAGHVGRPGERGGSGNSSGSVPGTWRNELYAQGPNSVVEEVPTSFLMQFTGPPPEGTNIPLDPKGISESIVLEVDFKKGIAILGEGRHRLYATRNAGYDKIPCRVMRTTLDPNVKINDRYPQTVSLRARPNEHGYIPADLKPSDAIDIPPIPSDHIAESSRGRFSFLREGGPGSGNRGHVGRPGLRGGSGAMADKATALTTRTIVDQKHLSGGEIDSFGNLVGNVNPVYVGHLEGGMKVIFKPDAAPYDSGKSNIHYGKDTQHEIAAMIVNEHLGGLVDMPAVAQRDLPNIGHVLIMEFKHGSIIADNGSFRNYNGNLHQEQIQHIALFDAVIGNEDRHDGNALVTRGNIIAIDHGISFPFNDSISNGNHGALNARQGDFLSADERTSLSKLVHESDAVNKELAPYLDKQEIDQMWNRVTYMLRTDEVTQYPKSEATHTPKAWDPRFKPPSGAAAFANLGGLP
jgi:phosphoinositide 3-/4-kinase-like protein